MLWIGYARFFEYQAEEQDCHFSFNLEAQTLFADPELFSKSRL